MNVYIGSISKNKSEASTAVAQQKAKAGQCTPQLNVDNPEAIAQRKLMEVVNGSTQVQQMKKLQEIANKNTYSQNQSVTQKKNNTGLPDHLKTGIENLSGYSMDDVKVHYNSDKPSQLQAHAYAQGTEIHVASGQEKHLPHEAWHVVQQKQGRVKPTTQMTGGVKVNDNPGLEKEADVMGQKAMKMKARDTSDFLNINENNIADGVIQAKWTEEEEGEAQKVLGPIDGQVVEVPVANVLNQQAWMGTEEKGMAKMIPKEYGRGFLQGIKADKVIKRAAQIALEKVKVDPPPVAFSTDTATSGNPLTGELILTDSHHTKNALILLTGAETMAVTHIAKPDLKGADTLANIALSRATITANMKKAASYNANEGMIAYDEARQAIEEMKKEMSKEEDKQDEKVKKEDL
ncbi:hypothetical protein C900_02008 [Fulvivirga imtechensis AK7]|uniref:eCIS core domain-containing protein n=1 Tax=Fulvivirga imtechensis AK7 TaxID=1237149 RepID=L8JUV2_9BACT|nr:DUF4157 domain-containing protein [Fulvivirga imtechensis]ELR72013.1 hypothetical protein C900_02008 [Fulvivirga imtechensis AK7]